MNKKNPHTKRLPGELFKKIVPLVAKFLKKCKGEDRRVTNKDLCYFFLQRQKHIYIKGAQFRGVVKHIRDNGLVQCLIADSRGYYVATNREEMTTHINSLKKRARSQLKTAEAEYQQLIENWDKLAAYPKAKKVKKSSKKKNNKKKPVKKRSNAKRPSKKRKPVQKISKRSKKISINKQNKWTFPNRDQYTRNS